MGMKLVETEINILQYYANVLFLIMEHINGAGIAIKVFDGPGKLSPVLFDSIFATGRECILHSAYLSHIILPINLQEVSVVLSYIVENRDDNLFIDGKYYGAYSNMSDNYVVSELKTYHFLDLHIGQVQSTGFFSMEV